MSHLTSNVQKATAHLDDTRALVDVWDPALSADENVARILDGNLLGLPTRSRSNDVIVRALRPRFIEPGSGVIDALRALSNHGGAFRDACYYEVTRDDELVAAFAEERLKTWWDEGRLSVDSGDARDWIDKLAADHRIADWSPNIRDRVARGLLATLRDLGRLEGAPSSPKKQIARPDITLAGFAYVAYRLHQQGVSSRGILRSPVWRRWLLDDGRPDELMHRLSAIGVVYYSVAGSSLRIDWRTDSLPEVVRAAL